jgi:hypothetical protein
VLHQNYPNPFSPSTIIRFEVAQAGLASVKIYDVAGTLVKTVFSGRVEPRRYEIAWLGEDEQDRRVAPGVYFCRLQAPGYNEAKQIVLIR